MKSAADETRAVLKAGKYSPSRLDEVNSDLSPNLFPTLEWGFDSYTPSLVGKGWGLGDSDVHARNWELL